MNSLHAASRLSIITALVLGAFPAGSRSAGAADGSSAPPRLIVRSDDMGFAHSGNLGILETIDRGITTSVEVMVPTPWFPEAVAILNGDRAGAVDVGVHLTLSSEWSGVKWRPLTPAPSLVDEEGHFFPMIFPNPNFPGRSLSEQSWAIDEIEREFRAQIETALRHLPRISHLSGHMGCTGLNLRVRALAEKLAAEYGLLFDTAALGVERADYAGPRGSAEEKTASFLRLLEQLEPGRTYQFVDHPGIDSPELRAIRHVGYENVADDRQGVTTMLTDPRVIAAIADRGIDLIGYDDLRNEAVRLPRSTPEAEGVSSAGLLDFLAALGASDHELHSLMLLRNGRVVAEGWWAPYRPDLKHALYSVSKSFTSTAVGLAVGEKRLALDDRVTSFFSPGELPDPVPERLPSLTVRHLLTMSVGQDPDPSGRLWTGGNWEKDFLATPLVHDPGSRFLYNSMATYLCSAIVSKATGQRVVDYLRTRLFAPLGIADYDWERSPTGHSTGGWGLRLRTEDMAKFGQLFLRNGAWNGRQVIAAEWIAEATGARIDQRLDASPEDRSRNDWLQGYGFQFWRCRHNAFRADGAFGQYIIVMPDQDAVLAITSETGDMQGILDLVWEHLLPAIATGPLPPDEAARRKLADHLASLALDVPPASAPSPAQGVIAGQEYALAENDLGLAAIRFDFEDGRCTAEFRHDSTIHPVAFGAGHWEPSLTLRAGPSLTAKASDHLAGLPARRVAGAFRWVDDRTLELTLRHLESPHTETIVARFDGGDLVDLAFAASLNPAATVTVRAR